MSETTDMQEHEYRQFCKLQDQVRAAGFDESIEGMLKDQLLSNIGDQHFDIQGILFGPETERIFCALNFYKLDGSPDFALDHYVVGFRDKMLVPNTVINGVNLASLDDRLNMIDWDRLTQRAASAQIFRASAEQLEQIRDGIADDFEKLNRTAEGKGWALFLGAKHFSNTNFAINSPDKKQYNKINRSFVKTYKVPVYGEDTIPINLIEDLYMNGLPIPPGIADSHELYRVRTAGYHSPEKNFLKGFEEFEEVRYFSSLQKAVASIQQVPDENYQHISIMKNNDRLYRRMTVIDELKHTWVADKYAVVNLQSRRMDDSAIRWEINTEVLALEKFEQKSGLLLSQYGRPPDDNQAFQVFPPIAPQQADNTLKPKEANRIFRKPGKDKGGGHQL